MKKESKKAQLSDADAIEFRTLAEDAPVMLWLTNNNGDNIFSNSRYMNFIGREKVENMGGKAWFNALHAEDQKYCLDIFSDAFQTHKAFEMEYRLKRRDGEYRFILDRGEPYINSEGKFSGFIGSSTDISDRKSSEDELKKSHRELIQYNHEMDLINQLNSYLQVCRTLTETYPVISHYADKIFPDCSGALYLFNESKTLVESMAHWGKKLVESTPIIAPDDCWSLRQGREHIATEDDNKLCCEHIKNNVISYTCVPIIAQGEMLGMIHLEIGTPPDHMDTEEKERFFDSRQRLVKTTADNLALSLVSLKLREALKNQSIRDPLTQLYNRRHMEENLERELTRCIRAESGLGVIMADVDHFKTFNDNYGHDAGDLVLVEVAKFFNEFIRGSDIICRYGGEEFLITMPDISKELILKRVNGIREGVKNLEIIYNGELLPNITCSFGVSYLPDNGEQISTLIKSADKALYTAKNNGRDRVVVAKAVGNRRNKKVEKTSDSQRIAS